ncbi:MAG: ribose-phosphate diphosphokinase [Macromonas sp.]
MVSSSLAQPATLVALSVTLPAADPAPAPSTVALLHFDDEIIPAQRLAQAWNSIHAEATSISLQPQLVQRHRFPDGELKLRLPTPLPPRVVLWRGLHQPNEKLVELLLATRTARALGARHLTLIAPYLGYMRQDIAFAPGEAVSQRIVGTFLANLFDALITVDPHLHRVATLAEAVPVAQPVVVSGAPVLADWIHQQRPGAVLIGPDEEAAQWVAQAAERYGNTSGVCRKVRHGDHDVSIALPVGLAVQGRAVVVLDDVISTGHTVAQAARLLLAAGAASVDVAATHALLAPGAEPLLQAAGVTHLWSTDCIPHVSSVVPMAAPLATALAPVLAAQ